VIIPNDANPSGPLILPIFDTDFFSLSSASACPLLFPDTMQVAKSCGDGISNKTACCNAMESYVSHLQKQSFITNLQALDCAETLAMKLKGSNITADIYGLCHISLKDFSLQGWFLLSVLFSIMNSLSIPIIFYT